MVSPALQTCRAVRKVPSKDSDTRHQYSDRQPQVASGPFVHLRMERRYRLQEVGGRVAMRELIRWHRFVQEFAERLPVGGQSIRPIPRPPR